MTREIHHMKSAQNESEKIAFKNKVKLQCENEGIQEDKSLFLIL